MSAFGTAFGAAAPVPTHNPNKDYEVTSPPSDGVSSLAFSPVANLLVAGSWDNQVRCWDVQPNGTSLPKAATQHDQPVPERVYAADVQWPLLVVGTANRRIQVFNLTSPQQPYKDIESPLKFQTRCIAAFPDTSGYLVGSIEGRVAVQHVEDAQAAKNFTFKCHRDGADIFAVNSISFHPLYGTFVTTGGDGAYNFWDKDSKQRLKAMAKSNAPIPCGAFNRDGSIYSYAVSYDWSHGYGDQGAAAGAKHHILLHPTQEAEVKNRQRVKR